MGTGALQFAGLDYLGVWLRLVLSLRNIGLPRRVCHRLIDLATSRITRKLLDHKWFGPAVFLGHQIGRKIVRNLIYQPLVKPLTYLWRPRRAAAAAQAQEWRLPETNLAAHKRRAVRAPAIVAG